MQAIVVIEWEACVRVDASSRLQLLTAGGEEQLVLGFDSLALSGKSLTKLHLSTSGVQSPLLVSPAPDSVVAGAEKVGKATTCDTASYHSGLDSGGGHSRVVLKAMRAWVQAL